jgi:hypothetical protein
MPGVATEKGSKIEELILNIRKRKGLKPEIPTLDRQSNTLHGAMLPKCCADFLLLLPPRFAPRRVLRQALSEECTLGFSDLLLCSCSLLLARCVSWLEEGLAHKTVYANSTPARCGFFLSLWVVCEAERGGGTVSAS